MTSLTTDMMAERRSALDRMAELPGPAGSLRPFAGIRVELHDHLPADRTAAVTRDLVLAVSDRLVRDDAGVGAVVVTGLSRTLDVERARAFNETLFREVWEDFRVRSGHGGAADGYRIKTTVTSDGAIPPELYGSRWSFKALHMDRDALLFSHVYGPAAGFTGGAVHLVDVRAYMRRHTLRFDDLFTWSDEPTEGSKPVLREGHHEAALGECGVDLGALGPDAVLFVNNLPSSGILHGVTPVAVTDQKNFIREFHRCSVRGLE